LGTVASTTLVIAGFLVLISLVQPAAERLRLPYTVLLAFVGVAVGTLSSFLLYTPLISIFDDIVAPIVNLPISASIFLIVFLPLLLFHAALTIDVREIAQDAAPILTLAILAVFAAAAAIGFSLNLAGVPLIVALLLGALVATTDPAAVVTIFREVGAPPRPRSSASPRPAPRPASGWTPEAACYGIRASKASVAPAGVPDGENLDACVVPAVRNDVVAGDQTARARTQARRAGIREL